MSKIAIIGANRGIGLEFCKQYMQSDQEVFAFCRQSNDSLKATGAKVIEGCDVSNETKVSHIAKDFADNFFDIFIHVSGIMEPTPWPEFESSSILKQFKINSLAPITTIRCFEKSIKPGAKIGVLTSRMGSIADNDSGGSYGYRMSKAALNAALKSLSIDCNDRKWTVLALHPGWVKTDMTNNTGLINTEQSVAGLIKIISNKSLAASGKFFHTNGEELPW